MPDLPKVRQEYEADTRGYSGPLREAAQQADRFSDKNSKAALAARKMGLAAAEAADKAARAQKDAADAAEKHARGELSLDEAANAAAKAERELERASIAAAEAQRAVAHAAEDAARQERQAARDAELAGAAQKLAALKAAGAVREHNALLKDLEGRFGDLSKEGGGAFQAIGTDIQAASTELAGMSPAITVGVANALAMLPTIAAVAADGITLGLGGAIAAVGIKFAAQNKTIRAEYSSLGHDIFASLSKDSAPFVKTLDDIAKQGRATFGSWEPEIRSIWADMAPVVDKFATSAIRSLDELKPALTSITRGFDAQLNVLGPQLAGDMHNVATGIGAIGDAAAKNPQALASLVNDLSLMVRYGGDAIGFLVRFKSQIDVLMSAFAGPGPLGMLHVIDDINRLGHSLGLTGHGSSEAGKNLAGFGQQAAGADVHTSALTKDMQTLASQTASATAKANALSDAFTRLLNPAEAVFTDTTRLKQGLADMTAALKKSHGSLDNTTASARAARGQFTGLLDDAKSMATDMTNSGRSINQVRAALIPYIDHLYKAAGANKQARQLVDAFTRSLGLVPPTKGTRIIVPGADSARARIQALQRSINQLHGRTVTIDYIERVHRTLQAERARADGGIDRYADGGMRRDLPPFIAQRPTVLFGETETGGEAYIPLGQSKRARSTELLGEVADMFGLELVKPLADGLIEKYAKGRVKLHNHPGGNVLAAHAAEKRIARARSRPEYLAALAAQESLQRMRTTIYGGYFRGGPSTLGSAHGTVVQHNTNLYVTVQGSVTTVNKLASDLQSILLRNRMPVSLPPGR